MLINDKGIIDGAGLRFMTLLGSKIVGLPLQLIFTEKRRVSKSSKIKIDRFYAIRNYTEDVESLGQEKYKTGIN